jgi:hypothetical protein
MCPAPPGNEFWKLRSTHGRERLFESAKLLQEACYEYFQHVQDNPLKEHANSKEEKMRAMTIGGLCVFLRINRGTWNDWRKHKDFAEVMQEVEGIIYDQKFTAAAAGFLNANLISRELGLADKNETEHSGSIDLTGISDDELNARIAAHIAKP